MESNENDVTNNLSSNSPPSRWTLLYYHYYPRRISPETRSELQTYFQTSASTNKLVGRVRVAFDGVNATLGAYNREDLERHAFSLSILPGFGEPPIDFKYALSNGARSNEAIEGCRFNTFEAKLVDEIVTMNVADNRANPLNNGTHLTPAQFHDGLLGMSESTMKADIVIDVRNSYESDIGRFCPPHGVPLLVPNVRTFAEMPAFFDKHEDILRGKNVFMYCTGGVRCERASAYIREKGGDFSNVFQLHGGVQRYLEAAEAGSLANSSDSNALDSSLWGGRLFVFDERRPVRLAGACPPPPSYRPSTRILSSCILCKAPWDEYEWLRCGKCSILVLVCDTCIQNGATSSPANISRLRCINCSSITTESINEKAPSKRLEKIELKRLKEEREERGREWRARAANNKARTKDESSEVIPPCFERHDDDF
jgi:predicted sulfurtransferase